MRAKLKHLIALAVVAFAPAIVFAQNSGLVVPPAPSGVARTQGTFSSELLGIINVFLGIVGLIAVAFIIYGGFRYIISAGNEEAAEAGKKTLTNAIIGLVIIIFSWVIVRVVIEVLVRGRT